MTASVTIPDDAIYVREQVEPGIDAVYYWIGPDYGVAYVTRDAAYHVDTCAGQDDAHGIVTKMVSYGREYAAWPTALS